ncbi:MAG: hypothetical protein ACYTGL_23160 [Planctomycetota bacterium]|jgi:hypothetical protein
MSDEKEGDVIPRSWLQKRWDIAELEAAYACDGTVFGGMNKLWEQFKAQIEDSDELWEFRSSEASWEHLAGRAGFAVVRDGKVIDCLVTLMN